MSVYKRGGTYWFTFIFDGRRIQKSSKQANRKAAIDIESAYRTALAKGEVGIAPAKKERRTVGELLDALKTRYEQEGKLSAQNKSLISRAKQDFDSTPAIEVTPEDVEKYIHRRKAEGAENSSVNRVTEVLRRAYKLAGIPAPAMERLSESGNVRQGFFSEAELAALISHLPVDLQDFTRFAAACGMRKGECSSLTWAMVQDDELRIPGNITKNHKDRILPITGELAEIIERRRAAVPREKNGTFQLSDRIFSHADGTPIKEFRKTWAQAAKKAGCAGKLFHDLRRTAVRNMVQAGIPTQIAKRWSGHKSDSMFERYSILTTDDMRLALQQTEQYRESQREKVVAIAK